MSEDIYYPAARNFLKRYQIVGSDHIVNIMVSIMRKRDDMNHHSGSFVESIINNDLRGAVDRADSECIKHLRTFVLTKHNCFPEDELKYHLVM